MREVRLRIPDALYDLELILVVECLESTKRGVQSDLLVHDLVQLPFRQHDIAPGIGQVTHLVQGNHGIQSVIAPVQEDHHQDMVVGDL